METLPHRQDPDTSSPRETAASVPLCVDLDGTLVKTNTLLECVLRLVKTNPGTLWRLPLWLPRGQAYVWGKVGPLAGLDVGRLPLRAEVVELIRAEGVAGRQIVLVTGAHQAVAAPIAERVGGFHETLATSAGTHLVGARKAELLVGRFGAGGFDYAGDSSRDLPVWRQARQAIVVNGSAGLIRKLRRSGVTVSVLAPKRTAGRALFGALRPHQWAKNLLVFIPLMLGHKLNRPGLLASAAEAFLATCVAGSGTYLINDLLDLEADRAHAVKRHRPLASGELALGTGMAAGLALVMAALAIAGLAGGAVAALVAVYLVLSSGYSLWWKRVLALDVILLAGLYCLRLLIGSVATNIPLSPWTVAFSMFLFLSLALMKRYSELHNLKAGQREETAAGRSYRVADMPVVSGLGAASSMTAVLVVALYVNGNEVRTAYGHPDALWLICVFVLLWITRLWLLAGRGELDEDPVLFALTDPWSLALGVLSGLAVLVAL